MGRRVVITGVGFVSPLGSSRERLWEALSTGRSAVRPLASMPTESLPVTCGGEAVEFTGDIENFGPLEKAQGRTIRKGLKLMCREIAMGVASAQLALTDASLAVGNIDPDRTGCVFGSDYIMTRPDEFTDAIRNCVDDTGKFNFDRWAERGLPAVDPLWLLRYLPNMPNSHIAIYNDLRGPNNAVTMREASSNLALAEAYCTILRGSADAIVSGATGTRIHPMRTVHVTLQEEVAHHNGADPATLSRPFDRERTGMVVGEGAGAIVLESLEAAERRGARILAEVVGYGSSTVADRNGVARCEDALVNVMRQALSHAEMTPEEVGHINAHGLATRKSDAEEARAIQRVFGERGESPPVVALKSYMGNLGAGSGLVELIASLEALSHDQLFPTLNFQTPDPECPVNVVADQSTPAGDSALSVNVTPQGQASAILVRKLA